MLYKVMLRQSESMDRLRSIRGLINSVLQYIFNKPALIS